MPRNTQKPRQKKERWDDHAALTLWRRELYFNRSVRSSLQGISYFCNIKRTLAQNTRITKHSAHLERLPFNPYTPWGTPFIRKLDRQGSQPSSMNLFARTV